MTQIISIIQCEKCLRYVADGVVHSFLVPSSAEYAAFKAAQCPQGDCGLPDCAEVAAENVRKAAEALQASCRRISAWRTAHRGPKRGQKSLPACLAHMAGHLNRQPYKDEERFEGAVGPDLAEARSAECGARNEKTTTAEVAPALDEAGFQASGKADSADAKMIEFFDHQIKFNLGKWFSRNLLKEICGNDYINNRVITARKHYKPLGYWIQNAEVSPDGIKPKSSHYRILKGSEPE